MRLLEIGGLAFVAGSSISLMVFVAICCVILVLFLVAAAVTTETREQSQRAASMLSVCLAIYLMLIAAIVNSKILERAFIPLGPMYFVTTIGLAMAIGFSPVGSRMAAGVPLAFLVGFQAFRLPLECVLHEWYLTGTIPESMTWSGSNWDIASGMIALAASPLAGRWRILAWLANLVGIFLLINVGRVAILSSPVPFGWDVEPKLELISHLPYAYIVPICVGAAALGHVLLTRRLLIDRAISRSRNSA